MPSQPEDARTPGRFFVGGAEVAAPALQAGLYLVATPIGNLSDITLRGLETLAGANVVACEDTRVTRILLQRYGIGRRLTAYHEHNAPHAGAKLIAAIEAGQSVALASDAGTPLISDPGFRLVQTALSKGLPVIPIPGASAVLAALTVCGLPSDAFLFAGFLPTRAGQRTTRLRELAAVPATLVFFESPRRLAASLGTMKTALGERQAVVARELTKRFEETRRGTLSELSAHYHEAGAPKGEVVVCVAPPTQPPAADARDVDRLLKALAAEMPAARAAAEAARRTGGRKSEIYRRLLALRRDDGET